MGTHTAAAVAMKVSPITPQTNHSLSLDNAELPRTNQNIACDNSRNNSTLEVFVLRHGFWRGVGERDGAKRHRWAGPREKKYRALGVGAQRLRAGKDKVIRPCSVAQAHQAVLGSRLYWAVSVVLVRGVCRRGRSNITIRGLS